MSNVFRYIENKGLSQGKDVSQMTLEEMDAWWEEAKKARHLKNFLLKMQEISGI